MRQKSSSSVKPESFLNTFSEQWYILSEIYHEVEDQPFHENLFINIYKKLDPFHFRIEDAYKTLESIKRVNIIEPVPRSDKEYVFVHLSLGIVEGLLNEYRLSLHGELLVRIDALNDNLKKIENSIDEDDLIGYHNACNDMDRILRTIMTQAEEAKVAIFRLVEEAKLFPKEMPLKKRYAKTIDAWDEFVSPIIDMCDPNNKFSKTLNKIENTISSLAEDESILMLSLETDRKRLHVINARVIDFQEKIITSAEIMAKTIKPIVQMIRLNNKITSGATYGLKLIEQNGLNLDWIADIGAGVTKIKSTIRHGHPVSIESFMLKLLNYEETKENVPSISSDEYEEMNEKKRASRKVSEIEVINFMMNKLPSDNIYQVVSASFPDISPKTLINCVTKLSRKAGYELSRDDDLDISLEHQNTIFTFKNRNIIKGNK